MADFISIEVVKKLHPQHSILNRTTNKHNIWQGTNP